VSLGYELFGVCGRGSHTDNEDINGEGVYAVVIITKDKYNSAFIKDANADAIIIKDVFIREDKYNVRLITILWPQQTVRSSCGSSMFNGIGPEPTYKRFNSAYLQKKFLICRKIPSNT
jgi:hypothetical protein